jgi:ribulose-phosphate 3-epimerase
MPEIVPALLEKNFNEIKNKLQGIHGLVKTVHVDFCDGVYVPSYTWPFATGGFEDQDFQKIINEEEGLPYWQEVDYEFDLMVADGVENFDIYMKLGPKRMIFHLDAQKNLEEFKEFLEGLDIYVRENVEIGLAFKPHDDLELVEKFSHKVDFLHCMNNDQIGTQGKGVELDSKALEVIKKLKEKLPGITISADIGINRDTAPKLLAAGADRLSVGSAIWKSGDPIGALEEFQSLL